MQLPGAAGGEFGAEACQAGLPEPEEGHAGERALAQVGKEAVHRVTDGILVSL